MEMRRLVSRISNSELCFLASKVDDAWSHFDGCVDLTTPLGHETIRSSTGVRAEPHSESGFVCLFRVRDEPVFLYFLVFYAYPW